MAKDDNRTVVDFPLGGINVAAPFDLQPPGTTPTGVNVRAHEPITLRARGGSRPGLERLLPALPTGSLIQDLAMLVDPTEDALVADTDEDVDPNIEYIDDPSTSNLKFRIPDGATRRVRRGGSGHQSNLNIPRVLKRTPDINWDHPADIGTHSPLSGTQLNATATDPITHVVLAGTFAYTPPSGTFMSAGSFQSLSVHFTPSDTNMYSSTDGGQNISVFAPVIGGGTGGAPNATSVSFSSATGDLLLVFVAGKGGSGSISDTKGNSYSLVGSSTANGYTISAFYTTNAGPDGSITISTDGTNVSIGGMILNYYSSPPTLSVSTDSVTVTDPATNGTLSVGTVTVSMPDSAVIGAWLGSQTPNQSIDGSVIPSGYNGGCASSVTTSGKEVVWTAFSKKPFSSNQSPTRLASANASGGDAHSVGIGISIW